jgi:hypothetical protein
VEVIRNGKHSSLLQYNANYWRKKFYSTGPRLEIPFRVKHTNLLSTGSAAKKKREVLTRRHRVGRRKDGVVKVLRTVGRRRRTQKVDPLRPGVGGKLPGVDDAVNKLGSLEIEVF